ncbi:hypothetical protein BDV29DRAFT_120643 [Aspergillus leporis]|uniref:Uncharacterized protein n=1 Tax=Aspergillus leporis TaxID=41062 RepID=A0A5N5XIJ0_9EURO|nr:hypothetical protein BDV29DRAFT_120643 [Aspergillus leporis]
MLKSIRWGIYKLQVQKNHYTLMHKHSMPPTGPRVMDSPIRPNPPGLERRWKVAARGTVSCSCSGCQSLVSGPLGHFPSVIIPSCEPLARRLTILSLSLSSFFPFFSSFYP